MKWYHLAFALALTGIPLLGSINFNYLGIAIRAIASYFLNEEGESRVHEVFSACLTIGEAILVFIGIVLFLKK